MPNRTVRTHADLEGMFAAIYEDDVELARAYAFVKHHGSWVGAKYAAIAAARQKVDDMAEYGPPPPNSDEPLPDLHAVD